MKIWWIDHSRFEGIPKKYFLPLSTKVRDYPKNCVVVKSGRLKQDELFIYFVGLNNNLLVKVRPKRNSLKYTFSGQLDGISFSKMADAVELIQRKTFNETETRVDPYEFTLSGILSKRGLNYGKAKA